ncbi:quinone-dependent dihydroorotate dehydrogenase [SAR202 cluster bacterium AC-647-N09_OGT_505m]|nr:quinone-dependent dihydroorotate dehydrogenase [SAR202 cluster bacterium AC-647-N09_OGT_505m]
MDIYAKLIRPLLFVLPPERAQKLAEVALRVNHPWKALRPYLNSDNERLHVDMGGISVPNPIGLAAGYDKDCVMVDALSNFGFGYIVAGTVVAEPRQGNPRPRIVRNPSEGSLVNSLGFPSHGLEAVYDRLKRNSVGNKRGGGRGGPLLASISGLSIEEFSSCYQRLQPLIAGIELNISSPNTEGIRMFQEPERLEDLLSALKPLKEKPLFLKLPPYFDERQRSRAMELVDLCLRYGVEGVTVANTRPVEEARLAIGRGGLSGRPLFPDMLRMVREIRRHAGDGLIINACGGISSGEDALKALQAGANTVQLFTGFIYGGPGLIRKINKHILRYMEQEGLSSVKALPREQSDQPSES